MSGVALTAGTHVLILNLADKVTMLHIIITLEGRPTENRVMGTTDKGIVSGNRVVIGQAAG